MARNCRPLKPPRSAVSRRHGLTNRATGRKNKGRQDSYAPQIIKQGGAKWRQVERAVYSPLAAPVPPTLNT
ncbi:hypothetical protein F441_16747, partial [Phytophthora nicotianae CJ01A1]